ncbi:response regulator [Pseudoxanthomonas sp. UTMC 1351]|uniref:response regulator n=1 Tax=Pseudoxanthomonas sp. UTMC 1351 TaxID=2695853 RepID=UPI0034CFA69A
MYRVIVVDDHPMVCAAIKALLEGCGQFEVIAERSNGSAGLAAVREMAPDLLIVDLDIPMLGGLEVIRRVRASEGKTAIVVVSAADERANGIRVLRMGANGFVHKGGALNELITAALLAVQGKSFFCQDVLANAANYPRFAGDGSIGQLSEKEFEVFRCLAQGQSNVEIASHMLISNKTVSAHKRRIMSKLGLTNIRDLIELGKSQSIS